MQLFLIGWLFCITIFGETDADLVLNRPLTEEEEDSRSFILAKFIVPTLMGPSAETKKAFKDCVEDKGDLEDALTICVFQYENRTVQELKTKLNLTADLPIGTPPHAEFSQQRFCGLTEGGGPCYLQIISLLKCTGDSYRRLVKILKMESKISIAEGQGMCSEKGRKLIYNIGLQNMLEAKCFQQQMVDSFYCKAAFVDSQASAYLEEQIDQFGTIAKQKEQDCLDILNWIECLKKIEKRNKESESQCSVRQDIYDNFNNSLEVIQKTYYPFSCPIEHPTSRPKGEIRSDKLVDHQVRLTALRMTNIICSLLILVEIKMFSF